MDSIFNGVKVPLMHWHQDFTAVSVS